MNISTMRDVIDFDLRKHLNLKYKPMIPEEGHTFEYEYTLNGKVIKCDREITAAELSGIFNDIQARRLINSILPNYVEISIYESIRYSVCK